MYYLEQAQEESQRMRRALLAACVLHVAALSAVSFDFDVRDGASRPQIEVTLAVRPTMDAPDEARHIAQANQQGSGEAAEMEAVTSRDMALPLDSAATEALIPKRMETDSRRRDDLLATVAAAPRKVASEPVDETQRENPLDGISPEVDRLNRELASLQAELAAQTQAYANQPRVRRLTAVSARQAADAAYLADWRKRLEAVGNKYYPEASVRYGIYGNLRLLVVIRKDGTLEDIRVLDSSGHAVLDEAAIKIVRMAAPYAPFPPELAETTDKLEIIRTWQFQENPLSSSQ